MFLADLPARPASRRRLSTIAVSGLLCFSLSISFVFTNACVAGMQDGNGKGINVATNVEGEFPRDEEGNELNFGFESGKLNDWTANGRAFAQQPIEGPIDTTRQFGEGKVAEHVGEYWLGGYEKLQDAPQGTLTSVPFKVTKRWASFLIGGGSFEQTRVELVKVDGDRVFVSASGANTETMRPVVLDLNPLQGQMVYVRVVDQHSGGWGHVNFDDFRVYDERPEFKSDELDPRQAVEVVEVYPHDGLDGESAAAFMQVPAGFKVQVGAMEPDINQPIAMAIDDRGRVWVAEAYEYPTRAPEGEGTDRILIFEDTDGNGSLDSRKIFAENLNLVSGLEVGHGGVFVGAAPYLLFIPDQDGDDVPDGEPEVLLDGWGYEDTHETLNAFIWGPDGWLYGCHGVFTHSRVGKPGTPDQERQPINAGIWRYHPVKEEFEVFAFGTSNPWGVDFDDQGQAFATACVIPHLFHIVQGGRYHRQAGSHFNSFIYNDIKTIAEHRHFVGNQWNDNDRAKSDELGGGHAHAGAMIYLGGSWPDEYRSHIIMNNIHGNRLNMDKLTQSGSGYVGSRAPDFLLTGDKWSQMINMRYGPDGQMWVIDWYDANQCHHREEDAHDRTNGRIYRVVYNNTSPVDVDLKQATDQELVAYQTHKNDWFVRHARRILQERAASGDLDKSVAVALKEGVLGDLPMTQRLRHLWALHVIDGIDEELTMTLLDDSEPYVRAWAIQLAMETFAEGITEAFVSKLESMAQSDASPVVRLYLASAAQQVPVEARWQLVENLAMHAEDANDHNIPLMVWYAAEPLSDVDAERALALAMLAGSHQPMIRDFMVRKIGSNDPSSTMSLLVKGLASAKDEATRLTFLRGIQESLIGRRGVQAPDAWEEAAKSLVVSDNAEIKVRASFVDAVFGNEKASEQLKSVASDKAQAIPARRLAVRSLALSPSPAIGSEAKQWLAMPEIRGVVLQYLPALAGTAAPEAVFNIYGDLTLAQRKQALSALASRPTYAVALLDAVDANQIPSGELSADLVRQLKNLGDEGINERIAKTWGVVRETSATVAERLAQTKQMLTDASTAHSDLEYGRAIFAKTCQQCHTLFGQGGKVGPDLTGSNRKDLDYLLTNILDPSSVMAKEYQTTVIVTIEGQVLTGIVRPISGNRYELVNETQTVVLSEDDIEEMQTAEKSMMPEDLLAPLENHEIQSLVAYLGADGQTPIMARQENVNGFFNGVDLTGWIGDQSLWTVEDGTIIGKSDGLEHNEFLVSEMSFGDFRFSCEVLLVDNVGNSGIQLRSQPMANGEVKGYQADIGVGWWGKLYEELGRGLLVEKSGEEFVKAGQWNRYEIIAVGSRVRTFINGQLCADWDDSDGARRGVFAFQLHSGGAMEVRFRDLKVELVEKPDTSSEFRSSAPLAEGQEIRFKKQQLDTKFRSEGATVGDFNNDGLMDIAAGSVWFAAPDWTPKKILSEAKEFNPKGYSDSFCNFAEDLNGDGRPDLIVVGFPGAATTWFENPGLVDEAWPAHEMTPVTNNESPTYLDIDGDGKRELLFGGQDQVMMCATPQSYPDAVWKLNAISRPGAPGTDRFSHGLGAGDVNRDGRADILVSQGWWEQPEKLGAAAWSFHPAPFGPAAAHMFAYDFDGDGDNDLVNSSAHDYGIWWYEQTEEGWIQHEIDKSYSQTHSLCLADINGDGLPDLVTGKRYWAHNGNDPGGNEPAVMFWYELQRKDGAVEWIPHEFDRDSGIGTQFEVVDVNGDGLLDVVTSNKKGVFYFEQTRE